MKRKRKEKHYQIIAIDERGKEINKNTIEQLLFNRTGIKFVLKIRVKTK